MLNTEICCGFNASMYSIAVQSREDILLWRTTSQLNYLFRIVLHYFIPLQTMKYIALVFSLYFALLAILPCQDREDMIASVIHITIKNGNVCNDQKGQETCPPFCTCSCCSTARILTARVDFALEVKTSLSKTYPQYAVPAVREQALAIWQPPQIV